MITLETPTRPRSLIVLRSPDLREHRLPSAELPVTYGGHFLISHCCPKAATLVLGGGSKSFPPS